MRQQVFSRGTSLQQRVPSAMCHADRSVFNMTALMLETFDNANE